MDSCSIEHEESMCLPPWPTCQMSFLQTITSMCHMPFIQTIALLGWLQETGIQGPHLVVSASAHTC